MERIRDRRGGRRLAVACGVVAAVGVAIALAVRAPEREPDAAGAVEAASRPPAAPAPDAWFRGGFESGDLAGWWGDLPRRESARVVSGPVREGGHAVRLTLAPGDRAAAKERVELRLGDRGLERRVAGDGATVWYAMSLFLPEDHPDPPEGQYPILVQWHHRPGYTPAPGERAHVTGPPPLALFLVSRAGRQSLLLVHHDAPESPRRDLGQLPIERGRWVDLLFEIRWSTGADGLVRAWVDGEPLTGTPFRGRTLYNADGNYLRLGYYRTKGGTTTNHVYFDAVALGASRAAVVP